MIDNVNLNISADYRNEIFKIHPLFSCLQVSNFGRVKLLQIQNNSIDNNINYEYSSWSLPYYPPCNGGGYPLIEFYFNDKKHLCYVHRLVVETFIGKIKDGMTINHRNHIKSCNHLDNLEIVSLSENVQKCYDSGNHSKAIPIKKTDIDGNVIAVYPSIASAARSLKMKPSYIVGRCENPFPDLFGTTFNYISK